MRKPGTANACEDAQNLWLIYTVQFMKRADPGWMKAFNHLCESLANASECVLRLSPTEVPSSAGVMAIPVKLRDETRRGTEVLDASSSAWLRLS